MPQLALSKDHNGSQSIWVTKWIYCMAIINQILNPLLPVALEIGQLHSMERLKASGIFCLNPKRIAIAGKIRIFCFDKTGTLTKEGLDFTGVQCLDKSRTAASPTFGPVLSPEKRDAIDKLVLHGLATCHAVTKFGKGYVGNQVEVKMFSSIGWELLEETHGHKVVRNTEGVELIIIRCYEFDHSRATMSVIVQDYAKAFHVYCKGSFEKIQELSSSNSLPSNYIATAQAHAFEGCYVLGLGHKSLGSTLSIEDVLSLKRDELERELNFIALLIFRNELKGDSRGAIESLKEGQIRPVMVTGDNAQCGHYIAKQCSMVASHVQVLLSELNTDNSISWSLMSSNEGNDAKFLSTEELLSSHSKDLKEGAMELAITGKVFNQLRTTEVMDGLLLSTRIFARFTPADKVKVATMHRDHGLVVGMCGDGGNDCGALRTAHAGLALSEAEASVVSPFTSKDKSVKSVVDLVREGRGALHTSFACYKFLIMYGLMFSILKLCAYWYGIIPCQMDYISIDGIAVLILAYAMTLSYPEEKLGKSRPTSSLLAPSTIASTVGVWALNLLFLVGAVTFMAQQKEYVKWPAKFSHSASWWTLGDNWESTVLFFTMYFQYITAAFIFTFGATYRKNVFANWLLLVSYIGLVALFSVLLLLPNSSFTSQWHVASEQFNKPNADSPVWAMYQEHGGQPSPAMPFSFRFHLWLLILGGLAAVNLWQKIVIEGPVARTLARKYPSNRLKFHF
ncbi:hypothetical protein O6H91_03G102700 [Diphasiastrum complanatum]|uniref:Uncharacterized protein n=1 Tax=Diphasiastrum complanatum TaxID=34168 RepID=A0ACC2E9V3_DIPCM|nr:hypothetical protein O6H91_03G102700 [Diphasiastrum complanatum]